MGRYSIVFDDVNASTWTSNYGRGVKALQIGISVNSQTGVGADQQRFRKAAVWCWAATFRLRTGNWRHLSDRSVDRDWSEHQVQHRHRQQLHDRDRRDRDIVHARVHLRRRDVHHRDRDAPVNLYPHGIGHDRNGHLRHHVSVVPNYTFGYDLTLGVHFQSSTATRGVRIRSDHRHADHHELLDLRARRLVDPADYPLFPNVNGNDRSDALAPAQNVISRA